MQQGTAFGQRIGLALVSHTNAGKTTLARTLLQEDIGEVRDAPHVTEFVSEHLLLRSAEGDELRLFDTPGFGDSTRLVKRLRGHDNPLGWLLSQVWDRWRDRSFWATQQALRHLRRPRDEAGGVQAVLYLVNAAESPAAAAYVEPEMELLRWLGKPVLVLLNQLGAPQAPDAEAAEVERWRSALARHAFVRDVLPLDAFARCWVHEGVLLRAVQAALGGAGDHHWPAGNRGAEPALEAGAAVAALERLHAAWWQRRVETFDTALALLASSLARTALAREPVPEGSGATAVLQRAGAAFKRLAPLFGGDAPAGDPASLAQSALAAAFDEEVRTSTTRLVALHGLRGEAQAEVLARVAGQFELQARLPEGRAALIGGAVSGALVGLKADLASGGLTLGGGLLAGGLIGALGAAGLARGVNLLRGGGPPAVSWSAEALHAFAEAALLRYLAVAHFGRGRGQWEQGEAPPHWPGIVRSALAPQRPALQALWMQRPAQAALDAGQANEGIERLSAALQPLLQDAAREALRRLYPAAWAVAPTAGGPGFGAESRPRQD